MKNILFFLLFQFILFIDAIQAQIENVIVETYYISDTNDATDTTGGFLEEGSVTYRIYIDLLPNTRLRKIYGDSNHALKISSTELFFNNKADGQSFGKDFSKNRLYENTVAVDSWLTLGQIARVSSKTCFGVLKINDDDGSFIGGTNNDGGSSGIPGGLLINNDPDVGVPLFISDGFDTISTVPTSWIDYGIKDVFSNVDSTIFGSAKQGDSFISNNAGLQNSGVVGVNPMTNQILVAQLTTKGELSFELNIEVEETDGSTTKIVKYVANDDILLPDERISPFLKYPQKCGCTDPNYLEYSAGYACTNMDSCKNIIKFGCMDSLACNFDPAANFNIPEICCYPGYCSDRDLSIVCPSLGTGRYKLNVTEPYPNPAEKFINFLVDEKVNQIISYEIYDSLGKLFLNDTFKVTATENILSANVAQLESGVYFLHILVNDKSKTYIFLKK